MKTNIIYNEDCIEGINRLPDESIGLLVTDPPYGIGFMGKEWDKFNEIVNPQGAYEKRKGFKKLPRQSSAFIIEFFTPIWKECLRVLKPGAFAFVMCIPRQDCLARMIVSLEDAGFNVSFSSIYHTFASGFPKASNIGRLADKRRWGGRVNEIRNYLKEVIEKSGISHKKIKEHLGYDYKSGVISNWTITDSGASVPSSSDWLKLKKILVIDDRYDNLILEVEREVIGKNRNAKSGAGFQAQYVGGKVDRDKDVMLTKSATPAAKTLDGSYGGFQPKPAVEVVIVAMKPLSEKTYVDQALKNGKGITWLNNCRVPYETGGSIASNPLKRVMEGHTLRCNDWGKGAETTKDKSNIISSQGRFPANLLVSDDCLNDGKVTNNFRENRVVGSKSKGHTDFGRNINAFSYNDSGSFSRYFSLDAWWEKRLKELPESVRRTFPFLIVPKVSKAEKNRGCEGLELRQGGSFDGNVDLQRKRKIGRRPDKLNLPITNNHPTVKPIKLMSYLITLGSRQGDIVLDPFIGSGTTAIAAVMVGRRYIGFETSKEYYQIAKARLEAERTLWDIKDGK